MENTQKIGKYIFVDGVLLPQNISKGALAAFYECTRPTLRSQLIRLSIIDPQNAAKIYTKSECESIFSEMGPIYYDSALESWKKYVMQRQKNRKYAQKRRKLQQKRERIKGFTII